MLADFADNFYGVVVIHVPDTLRHGEPETHSIHSTAAALCFGRLVSPLQIIQSVIEDHYLVTCFSEMQFGFLHSSYIHHFSLLDNGKSCQFNLK